MQPAQLHAGAQTAQLDAGAQQAAQAGAGAGAQQAAQAGAGAQQAAAQPAAGAPQPGADGYVDWTCTVCDKVIRVSAKRPDYFKDKHLRSKRCVPPLEAPQAGAAAAAAPKPQQQKLSAFFMPALNASA